MLLQDGAPAVETRHRVDQHARILDVAAGRRTRKGDPVSLCSHGEGQSHGEPVVGDRVDIGENEIEDGLAGRVLLLVPTAEGGPGGGCYELQPSASQSQRTWPAAGEHHALVVPGLGLQVLPIVGLLGLHCIHFQFSLLRGALASGRAGARGVSRSRRIRTSASAEACRDQLGSRPHARVLRSTRHQVGNAQCDRLERLWVGPLSGWLVPGRFLVCGTHRDYLLRVSWQTGRRWGRRLEHSWFRCRALTLAAEVARSHGLVVTFLRDAGPHCEAAPAVC